MNKKSIFTSFVALGLVCPAMATPTNSSNTFPSTGLMQEDYTYTNAATSTNLDGVFEGTVLAEAIYVNSTYNVPAGYYLPAGGDATVLCTSGNFCTGLSNPVNYDENNNQGLTSCSTVNNGYFPESDPGAVSSNYCYNTNCSGLAHSLTSKGRNYYSSASWAATCSALSCENGYHVEYMGIEGVSLLYTIGLQRNIPTWQAPLVPNNNTVYVGDDLNNLPSDTSAYGIENNPNTWVVDYGPDKGILVGEASCVTQGGTSAYDTDDPDNISSAGLLPSGEGSNCWCKVTGYKDSITAELKIATRLNGDFTWWYLNKEGDSASQCASNCTQWCADLAIANTTPALTYQKMLLGSTGAWFGRCYPNEITITWEGASAEAISANEAGSCTYGGDIRTPQSATPVPGKIFKGWRFKAVNNTLGSYTVTYDCNDGVTQPFGLSFLAAGDTVNVSNWLENCSIPSGYAFNGWNCDNNVIVNGNTLTMPAANVHCVAQWVD